ncbi:UDP-glucose dehydrogenase family protein [Coralloluteibacterium stylophorae]|uniref:UDP-glucose 6-dehydrogenase n=1 Tax=Coralloluteibacterium stylophorae TaxID=1776034 RepID=A0AAP2CE88_9GAMM|nr:UDP-glucose/GDP-mannose dehydrogenase family protein [Coralloluteibacterium stylophorae]
MKTTIFGTGYVGLVTGACLAQAGNTVTCVDIDQAKIEGLNNGVIPIYEPGLEDLVVDNHKAGRLRFTTSAAEGVAGAAVIFIAVGTPPDEDGAADLGYVLAVARGIGAQLSAPAVVVNKSTVPVGTVEKVRTAIQGVLDERGVQIDFDVVSNPEFLKEGAAVEDCMRPDRIVIGARKPESIATMRKLYGPFNRQQDRIVVMDPPSAELTKYAANAMLATKISFMNEIANIAECVGADIEMVRKGIGSDPRIGYHFIYPGAGYGGSCFPKDVKALVRTAAQAGHEAELLQTVEAVNARQKGKLFQRISDYFDGALAGKTIALWGLAFKPRTDDMREAPSVELLRALWAAGATARAFDPEAMREARRMFGERDDLVLCDSANDALTGADALVLVTEWKAFWSPDFALIRERLSTPVIFDGRNIYDPALVEDCGIQYYGIGRGRSVATPPAA